jgi:copper(I)-binding protein
MLKSKIAIIFLFTLLLGCNAEKKAPINNDSESKIENWARPGAKGQMSGAYFVYTNNLPVPDTLISVQSINTKMAQIHESYTTNDGLSGMREKKQIIIQPQKKLILKQGGLHLMLMDLNQKLSSPDTVSVSLNFSQAGKILLKLPVLNSN